MAGMFDDFCSDIHKQYKKTNDLIVADPHTTYTMIPTGSLEIDTEMNGGLAIVGRVVEVSGFESSGKTTLMSQSCVGALKMFPTKGVLYMDSEQSFDFTYAKSLGLEQNDRFKVFRPMNAEELDDVLTKAVAKLTSNISMIVIDSVASARTKAEITAVIGQSSQKSQHASFWGTFVLKLVMWASKYGIAIVLINQFRSKPSINQNDKFSLANTGIGNGYSNTECITYDSKVTIRIDGEEKEVTMKELQEAVLNRTTFYKSIEIMTPDGWQQVGVFIDKGKKEIKQLTFSNGSVLKVTDNHLCQDKNEKWVYAKDMKIGQSFLSQADDSETTRSTVLINITEEEPQAICDIEVLHENHRFFANKIVVHNTALDTTGGRAVKFYCSARYILKNISPLKEEVADKFSGEIEELRVANVCRIEAIKNKCYPPNKRVKYIIRFGTGTDDTPIIKDFLTKVGVIAVNGSMITYNGSIPELTFKENGKLRFNEHFTRPEFLEDAKKQFVTLKGTNYLENVVASNVDDIWDEGLGATDLIPSDTVEV